MNVFDIITFLLLFGVNNIGFYCHARFKVIFFLSLEHYFCNISAKTNRKGGMSCVIAAHYLHLPDICQIVLKQWLTNKFK